MRLSWDALDPGDAYNLGNLAQIAHDVGEVQAVAHLQREVEGGVIAFAGEMDVFDVGFGIGDGGGDFGQHAALVGDDEFDADLEQFIDVFVPNHVHPFLAAVASLAQARAVMRVDDEPWPPLDDANNRIPGNGTAAFGVLHRHAFGAEQRDDAAGISLGSAAFDLAELGKLSCDYHVEA